MWNGGAFLRALCRLQICTVDQIHAVSADSAAQAAGGDWASAVAMDSRIALAQDPANAYKWSDLGRDLFLEGDRARAGYCFDRSILLGPNLPAGLLPAANFYFQTGGIEAGLKLSAHILALIPDYDGVIFLTYLHLEIPIEAILREGLPSGPRAANSWMNFLLDQSAVADMPLTWAWLESHSSAGDPLAGRYAAYLLGQHEYRPAIRMWTSHVGSHGDFPETNLLFNGSFETRPSPSPFDWKLNPVDHVQQDLDPQAAHAGKQSLRVHFDGTTNVDFHGASQMAVLDPGPHRLEAWVKTEGITTDKGPLLHVFDPEHPGRLDVRTGGLLGTKDWNQISLAFAAPSETKVVIVEVSRPPTMKFDNKISGTLWLDSVTLSK